MAKLNKRHRKRVINAACYKNNRAVFRRKDGYGRLDDLRRYEATPSSMLRLLRWMLAHHPKARLEAEWYQR